MRLQGKSLWSRLRDSEGMEVDNEYNWGTYTLEGAKLSLIGTTSNEGVWC